MPTPLLTSGDRFFALQVNLRYFDKIDLWAKSTFSVEGKIPWRFTALRSSAMAFFQKKQEKMTKKKPPL